MKKSFSYNLTQFGAAGNTVTEQIKTSDGVKTITTDANTGAVILADQVDGDSLNPVTGTAVATAIAQGGGGLPEYGESDANKVLKVDAQGDDLVWAVAGGAYTAGNGISIEGDEIAVGIGSGGIQIDSDDNTLMIADEYGLVHVDDGAILVNHDDTISEETDLDGHGMLGVANPVPSASSADNGKVLGVTDSSGTLGWVSAGGSVVADSNSPFNGDGTAASPLGFNIDSDSLNVSASSIGPIAYADAKFTGDSAIGTLLDTSGTVTMTFTGLSWPGNPGDSAYITLTYGSYYLSSRTTGKIANDRSVTLTIDVHNVSGNGTWTADSTLYTIKIWDVQESSYAPYTNVTIVDTNKRLRINRPVPAAQSADNGKVLSVTDSSGSIGWANVNVPSELPSYTSGDRGKVLSVKQTSPGSSSSTVYWAPTIPGGQTLGSSATAVGSTISVICDESKSALYNLVCIVPTLKVDTSIVDLDTDYFLDLDVNGGPYTDTVRMVVKFRDLVSGQGTDCSTVAYLRWNSISDVTINSLKNLNGNVVTGNWLLSGSSLYVYGLA